MCSLEPKDGVGDGWSKPASSQAQGDQLDSNGLCGSDRLYITELDVCLVRFLAVTGGDADTKMILCE